MKRARCVQADAFIRKSDADALKRKANDASVRPRPQDVLASARESVDTRYTRDAGHHGVCRGIDTGCWH